MPVLLLVDPRPAGLEPALDPSARWGATTVRSAALANALTWLAGGSGGVSAVPGRRVVVVSGPTDAGALRGELAAFARIGARRFAEPEWTDHTALDRRLIDTDDSAVLVGWLDQPTATAALWDRLAAAPVDVVVAGVRGERAPARTTASHIGDRTTSLVDVVGDPDAVELGVWSSMLRTPGEDARYVEECLGRRPRAPYEIAARRDDGRPTVIENPPFLEDGRPMPTAYWLIDPELIRRIGTIESSGGVRAAEADLGLEVLAEAHRRYAEYRDARIPATHTGPRPSGGVGGTRVGVKCLHTHYAWYLAGGDDPVGAWTQARLDEA